LGAEVRLFDLLEDHESGFEFISGDVRDYEALERAARGCDIIFHFAALLGVEKILKIPLDVMEVNESGTVNALNAALKNDIERFIFSSSSEIYGEPRQIPVAEDTPPSPVSVYGISKLAAEAYCNAYAHTAGLKATCLRFFNVYGPGQAEQFVVSRFVSRVAGGQPPIIYGKGDQVRAYTYVADAVQGILMATAHKKGVNEAFNVGSGQRATVSDLAQLVIEVSGSDLTPIQKEFGDGIRSARREIYIRIPDTSKAKELLGFESCVSLREGVSQCYEWYLSSAKDAARRELPSDMARRFALSPA
jgi:UDP-glucose 4-epimerase